MRQFLALIVVVLGIALGLYVGGYLCFFKGIVCIIEGIKAGWIATKIAWGVIRVIVAGTVGWGIFLALGFVGYIFKGD